MGSWDGRGPQTDKTPAAKSLYRSIFLIMTFGIAFYQSNLSTDRHQQLMTTPEDLYLYHPNQLNGIQYNIW
jgi:hypothetical protein